MAIAVNATRRSSGSQAMANNGGFNVTLSSTPTALATLLISIAVTSDTTTVTSIVDYYSNIYTQVYDSGNHGTGMRTFLWISNSPGQLVSGDVLRVNCADSLFVTGMWAIDEVTGLGHLHVPDVSANAFSNTSVSAFSMGPTSATGYTNELVWAVIGTPTPSGSTQTITAGTGYTQQGARVTGASGSLYVEYKIVAATGAQTADGTINTTASKYIGLVATIPDPQTANRGSSFAAVEAASTTNNSAGSFAAVEAAYTTAGRAATFVGVEVAYTAGTPPPASTGRRPSIIVA